jgi:hypothetical protein
MVPEAIRRFSVASFFSAHRSGWFDDVFITPVPKHLFCLQLICTRSSKYSTMPSHHETKIGFTATGHANIQATHPSTLEITMDKDLTLRGDCIIGVAATHSAQTIGTLFRTTVRNKTSRIQTILRAEKHTEEVHGFGSPDLILANPVSLVWRKSRFIDDRTFAIGCDKAAADLNRDLVACLQNPDTTLHVAVIVSVDST